MRHARGQPVLTFSAAGGPFIFASACANFFRTAPGRFSVCRFEPEYCVRRCSGLSGCSPPDRIRDHKINRLDELLPWNWTQMALQNSQAA